MVTGDNDRVPEWIMGKCIPLRNLRAIVFTNDRRRIVITLTRLIKKKEMFEATFRFLRPSGIHRYIEMRAYPILDKAGKVTAIQGLARDVTDRVATETARRQYAAQYRDFIDLSPHMPWIADPSGRIVEMSRRYDVSTCEPAPVRDGDAARGHFHPDDVPAMVAAVTHALATGEPYESAYRIRIRDGQDHWVRASAVARRDEVGTIVAWYGFTEHIDPRKHAVTVLRERENQRRYTVEISPHVAFIADREQADIRSRSNIGPPDEARTPPPAGGDFDPARRPGNDPLREDIDDPDRHIDAGHLRAARALLDWSMVDLARASGLSMSTIRRLEENTEGVKGRSRDAAVAALRAAGIKFALLDAGNIAVAKC